MSYKCQICGTNEVDNPGDICEICAIGQDPYANSMVGNTATTHANAYVLNKNSYSPKKSNNRKVLINGGSNLSNQDPYGNDMASGQTTTPPVQVYSAGQAVQQQSNNTTVSTPTKNVSIMSNQPISEGITKNIMIDTQKKSVLEKWCRSLFKGVPFTLDNDVTMFQVFPDYSGTALNSMGNACDQVIVYGRLNNGAISENNEVEVYGRRDSNNNVIAKTIKNKASGTTISPMRTIGVGIVWFITAIFIALAALAIMGLGVEGLIWVGVIILCFTNMPLVVKIVGGIFGFIVSLFKRMF